LLRPRGFKEKVLIVALPTDMEGAVVFNLDISRDSHILTKRSKGHAKEEKIILSLNY
jgi:hypothetical protein